MNNICYISDSKGVIIVCQQPSSENHHNIKLILLLYNIQISLLF